MKFHELQPGDVFRFKDSLTENKILGSFTMAKSIWVVMTNYGIAGKAVAIDGPCKGMFTQIDSEWTVKKIQVHRVPTQPLKNERMNATRYLINRDIDEMMKDGPRI